MLVAHAFSNGSGWRLWHYILTSTQTRLVLVTLLYFGSGEVWQVLRHWVVLLFEIGYECVRPDGHRREVSLHDAT